MIRIIVIESLLIRRMRIFEMSISDCKYLICFINIFILNSVNDFFSRDIIISKGMIACWITLSNMRSIVVTFIIIVVAVIIDIGTGVVKERVELSIVCIIVGSLENIKKIVWKSHRKRIKSVRQ